MATDPPQISEANVFLSFCAQLIDSLCKLHGNELLVQHRTPVVSTNNVFTKSVGVVIIVIYVILVLLDVEES